MLSNCNKIFYLVFSLLLCLLSTGYSQTVIDFNGLPANNLPLGSNPYTHNEDGETWIISVLNGENDDILSPSPFGGVIAITLGDQSGGRTQATLRRQDGSGFSLASMDLSSIFVQTISISGWKNGVQVHGPVSRALPSFPPQTWSPIGWSDLDSILFEHPSALYFDIDEFTIGIPINLSTGTLTGSPYCPGASFSVPYTATAAFYAGNVLTAELSDASGSFASPTAIGTLTSTASSGSINVTIPAGTPAGSNYRIRVVSTSPSALGADNGTDLIVDVTAPTAVAQDITVQLDATGNATITAAQVDDGSVDNCGTLSLSLSQTTFTCADLGANTVTLTATDGSMNTNDSTATVTVEDNINPTAMAQDISVQLDATGNATITAAQLDNGSVDNCGTPSLSLSQTTFTCADLGANTVTLTATDGSMNATNATATVTVLDNINPMAMAQDISVQLDATGNATITAAMVDNGSSDNCGMPSLSLNQATFTCADLGANTVMLTATDGSGNTNTATATITVLDNIDPTAIAQNLSVPLDATGNATITAAMVDNGSSDNCGVPSLSLNQTTFTCANLGANTVTLTATDGSGNTNTTTATITVLDNIDPTATVQNLSVPLDATGNAMITAAMVDNGSSDNCGMPSLSLNQTTFTCANLGANTVTLTATDGSGNTNTTTATITVLDNIDPTAIAQNLSVPLDATGNATVTAAMVDDGSGDNCGVPSLSLSQTTFTCADLGANTVTLTVTDGSGNTNTTTATITVLDNIDPTAIAQNLSVPLDATGNATITAAMVDDGSGDNCGVPSLSLSQTTFTCADLGANTVTLTATDGSGNTNTATATITVLDNIDPTAAAQNLSVPLDVTGNATITAAMVDNGSSDNCGVPALSLSQTLFTCADLGTNTVTLTATDGSGNTSTTSTTITIADDLPPVVTCPGNITSANPVVDYPLPQATDNCTMQSIQLVAGLASGETFPEGMITVTYEITDLSGNVISCSFNVTVDEQNRAPTGILLDNTVLTDDRNGTEVGVFSTQDPDPGETHQYELVAGDGDQDNSIFSIQGNTLVLSGITANRLRGVTSLSIRVRSTDRAGASVETSIALTVMLAEVDLRIPTAFTPNSDGENDVWDISNIDRYPQVRVAIYNRNGDEIFSSTGYQRGWDGTYKGNQLPMDTYYYIIQLNDDQNRTYRGSVTILQ